MTIANTEVKMNINKISRNTVAYNILKVPENKALPLTPLPLPVPHKRLVQFFY